MRKRSPLTGAVDPERGVLRNQLSVPGIQPGSTSLEVTRNEGSVEGADRNRAVGLKTYPCDTPRLFAGLDRDQEIHLWHRTPGSEQGRRANASRLAAPLPCSTQDSRCVGGSIPSRPGSAPPVRQAGLLAAPR